jgi:uncharacterized protein (TIGR02145 family)
MKRILLFFVLIFAHAESHAQDYQVSFTGSGASTIVETVKVENLSQDTSLIINGTDVLHLVKTLGINTSYGNNDDLLKIFPNPSSGGSYVTEFESTTNGSVTIEIHDLGGKLIGQARFTVHPGLQTFRISGLSAGIFTLCIRSKAFNYTRTLVSISMEEGHVAISPISSRPQKTIKSTESVVQMQYNDGDQLLFTCSSGNYSTVIPLVPTQSITIPASFVNCSDGDNNHYAVVQIGAQLWMEENLKTTKYNDGTTTIPWLADSISWINSTTPAFAWYNNDPSGDFTYGALYNWYAASANNLCPSGWHVPTESDFVSLVALLGGEVTAGKKLKESGLSHWLVSTASTATNETGFTALPGGYRHLAGSFVNVGRNGYWWTSTACTTSSSWCIGMSDNTAHLTNFDMDRRSGFSVRCLKD